MDQKDEVRESLARRLVELRARAGTAGLVFLVEVVTQANERGIITDDQAEAIIALQLEAAPK